MCVKFASVFLLCSTLTTVFLPLGGGYQYWRTIYHKISQEPAYSGFYSMVKNNRVAKNYLHDANLTIFAPENEAVDHFSGTFTDDVVFYHMSFGVKDLKVLNSSRSVETTRSFAAPLWITKSIRGDYKGIYVNNAKIVEERSNYLANTRDDQQGKNQILHVIDQVLDPMIAGHFYAPTAWTFLNHPYRWRIGLGKIQIFTSKVKQFKQDYLYTKEGGHTFFVPVDFQMDDNKMQSLDEHIIQGHVVPNQVLFTRPCEKGFIFETAANGESLYIVLAVVENVGRYFVKSYTVVGDSKHRKGELLVEIVKPNIPVTNGVVHLIAQPLAIFERELKPFPYLRVLDKISADPYLNLTYWAGERLGFNHYLKNELMMLTYFVSRDNGWGDYMSWNSEAGILKSFERHLVVDHQRYSMAILLEMSQNTNGTILNTLAGPLGITVTYENGTYWIETDLKRIRVKRPDYECSDGVVHVLDEPLVDVRKPRPRKSHSIWWYLKKLV